MFVAGLAASAAFDLLSLLQPDTSTGVTAGQASFVVPEAASAQPQTVATGTRSDGLSADTLGTLLSAQGQTQAAHHAKRSMGVLLDLLQSSQDGSLSRSEFEAATGGSDGDSDAAKLFDRIDQNQDDAVNVSELTSFLDSYRRNADGATSGTGRALTIAA